MPESQEMLEARSRWIEEQTRLWEIMPNTHQWPLNLPELMLAFAAGWEARQQAAPFASTGRH